MIKSEWAHVDGRPSTKPANKDKADWLIAMLRVRLDDKDRRYAAALARASTLASLCGFKQQLSWPVFWDDDGGCYIHHPLQALWLQVTTAPHSSQACADVGGY